MPRPRNPDNEQGRQTTERWRDRRRMAGRPEASIIDRAIAASFAAFLSHSLRDDCDQEFSLRDVVSGAQRLLIRQGYDKRETNGELMRRMTRRADLVAVTEIAVTERKSP